jgi:hypothetical protein
MHSLFVVELIQRLAEFDLFKIRRDHSSRAAGATRLGRARLSANASDY